MNIQVGILVIIFIEGQYAAFSGKECLNYHNTLRAKHGKTQPLNYSKELEKSAQTYADKLAFLDDDKNNPIPTRRMPKKRRAIPATTDPFFHKEMWDGEILFPLSKWDLNKDRKIPIGESIHKFCCYSFPYCPSEFFHGLNFPPSAKGVTKQWYKEIDNYDFAKGTKKDPEKDIRHFTNIVWKKTTEVGCAQSKRSKKGCIYTIVRYQVEGSVGWEDAYKKNVASTTPVAGSKEVSSQSYLKAFLIVLFVILILVIILIVYIKRVQIKALYAEYQIKRSAKKAEANLRDDYDEESFHGRKSIIYKPSSKKPRPSIRVIQNTSPASTLPMKPRNPTQSGERISIIYKPDTDQCSIVKNAKPLPPRPTSPVKANTPPQRPSSQNISQRKDLRPPHPLNRASLPPPPPPPTKPVADTTSNSNEEAKANLPHKNTQDVNISGPSLSRPLAANKAVFESKIDNIPTNIKKPLPVPSAKPNATASVQNGIPKPAPRPGKTKPLSDQQFEPRPPTSRAPGARASRKNPNFRTLPLNDRGSVKSDSKTNEEGKIDWRGQLKKTDVINEEKPQQKPPLVPEGKKVPQIPRKNLVAKDIGAKENQQKRPLLPRKNIGNNENKGVDNDRPISVLERKRLLEHDNTR